MQLHPTLSEFIGKLSLSTMAKYIIKWSIRSSSVAVQLERETQALLASLEEKVERRLEELRMSLNANVLKKIRLSSADLKVIPYVLYRFDSLI